MGAYGGTMPKDADFNCGVNDGRTPVDQYSDVTRSSHGAVDFWGNVWEWTSTLRSDSGGVTVYGVKGGSCKSDRTNCRTEYRDEGRDGWTGYNDAGFRVIQVKDGVEPEQKVELATLLYQGQASIRIVTAEGKVIYIDPYAGSGYDLPADLILVTHEHFDHNDLDKIETRNPDCVVITHNEAIQNGEHQTFDFGYVNIDAVEAGYNEDHDASECVGYVLTFSNGKSVYVSGDTSTTPQMSEMSEMQIDYAFYCCDGVFNMGLEEAARCAETVGTKHNIPYHMTGRTPKTYDREIAEQFQSPNRLIIDQGEEIKII